MKYLIVISFFWSLVCSAQIHYGFDHKLEYEYVESENSVPEKRFIFTNSGAENYYLMGILRKDSLEILFLDYNAYTSSFKIDGADFIDNQQINLDCEIVYKLGNPYKKKIREHHIIEGKDTLIKRERHQVFIFKNQKRSIEKRKNLVRHFYVIENKTEYHKAVPLFHLIYEENKKEKKLPGGIYKLMYNVNYSGDTTEIYKLKSVEQIKKNISFKKDCENLK